MCAFRWLSVMTSMQRINIKPMSPYHCEIILRVSMEEVTEELSFCFNTIFTTTVTFALNGGQSLSH
jgi:hypothetical protein